MVLDQHPWTFQVAWSKVCCDHDDFVRFGRDGEVGDGRLLSRVWQPPPVNTVKLNTNGSFRPELGHMGGGGLVRDSAGNWVVGFRWFAVRGTTFRAEAEVLKEGLWLAWNRGYRDVICETDCADLIVVLGAEDRIRFHDQVRVLMDIRELLRRDWRVTLVWVDRERNASAD